MQVRITVDHQFKNMFNVGKRYGTGSKNCQCSRCPALERVVGAVPRTRPSCRRYGPHSTHRQRNRWVSAGVPAAWFWRGRRPHHHHHRCMPGQGWQGEAVRAPRHSARSQGWRRRGGQQEGRGRAPGHHSGGGRPAPAPSGPKWKQKFF